MAKAATAKAGHKNAQAAATAISKANAADNPLVGALQQQVANAYILYTNYKHYHWQTYGPLFRDLHLLFDEFAKTVLETVDEFAERVRMIGQDPVFDPTEMVRRTNLTIAKAGRNMREMIAEADDNLLVIIREMREGYKLAEDANDPGTSDLYARTVQLHEKHEWWLRDILERGDGLFDIGKSRSAE